MSSSTGSTNSDVGRDIYSSSMLLGAIICLLLTMSLIKRLYCSQSTSVAVRKVLHSNISMKVCSISCGSLLCIGFIMKCGYFFDETSVQYTSIGFFYHLATIFMDGGQALYFKYFVLSLRKLYRTNDIARSAISKPVLIATEIVIIFNITISVLYTLSILSIFHSTNISLRTKNQVVITYTILNAICNLAINMALIYLYKNIIKNYATNWHINGSQTGTVTGLGTGTGSGSESRLINEEHHLLLLLMTRYCSLIFISASMDIAVEIYTIFEIFIGNDYFARQHVIWTVTAGILELIDTATYIMVIYFSFPINNLFYEKYCFCIHERIYGAAKRVVVSQSDYIMMTDQVDDERLSLGNQMQLQYSSSYNGGDDNEEIDRIPSNISSSSARRDTNYFDDNMYVSH